MKLDFDAEIIPNESIGGIVIGQEIETLVSHLDHASLPYEVSVFSNFGQSYRWLSICDGMVSVVADESGFVVRIWCTESYNGTYQSKLRPGMTVDEIVACTDKQLVRDGVLFLDDEFGLGINIPDLYEGQPYDDIDSVDQLPGKMILSELHVMDRKWWP